MTQVKALLFSEVILARVGLRSILVESSEVALLGEAASPTEAVELTVRTRPEVVVIDAMSGASDTLEITSSLMRRCHPAPGMLVLANKYESAVRAAISAGANGLVLSHCSPREFISAVHLAAAGYRLLAPPDRRAQAAAASVAASSAQRLDRLRLAQLTDREFEVLQLVALGYGNAELSKSLMISESTVKSHIRSILVKLGLRNRVHLVIYAYEVGFVRIGTYPGAAAPAPRPTPRPTARPTAGLAAGRA